MKKKNDFDDVDVDGFLLVIDFLDELFQESFLKKE